MPKDEAPAPKPGRAQGLAVVGFCPNVRDVTHQHRGKLFAIVGVPLPKPPEEEES